MALKWVVVKLSDIGATKTFRLDAKYYIEKFGGKDEAKQNDTSYRGQRCEESFKGIK